MTIPAHAPLASARAPDPLVRLLDDVSFEMTAKDLEHFAEVVSLTPGTQISITSLPGEDAAERTDTVRQVMHRGFRAMPHIAARRLRSRDELDSLLAAFAEAGVDRLFVIAGDAARSTGPFGETLDIIETGLLQRYHFRHVGIGGHPDGHPAVNRDRLFDALDAKARALAGQQISMSIITQFGFDPDPVIGWLGAVRARGIDAPIRIGVAGPTNVKLLVRFAARCGVAASTSALRKYGISLTSLFGTAGPDSLIRSLAAGIGAADLGEVRLHFFPFGGLERTARWVRDFRLGIAAQP